jgi:hypothetical protein
LEPSSIEHEEPNDPYREIEGQNKILEAALHLMKSAARQRPGNDDNDIVLIRQGRDIFHYHPNIQQDWYDAMRDALSNGWNISKYVRPDTDDVQNRCLFLEIIGENISFADIRKRKSIISADIEESDGKEYRPGEYKPSYFSSYGLKRTPYEFLIIPKIGTLFSFTTTKYNEVDAAMHFSDSPKLLREHCRLLVMKAKTPLRVHQRNATLIFSDDLVTVEENPGDRLVAHPFLSSVTRPPSDLREGTSWGKRYEGKDREKRIETRIRRIRAMEEQLKEFHFKQICSKKGLSAWRENCYRLGSPKDGVKKYYEGPEERLSRLQNTIELLKRHDNFEIALLDEGEETLLRWNDETGKPNIGWMVKGPTVLIESWYPGQREPKDLRIAVRDPLIGDDFQKFFNILWKRISATNKNKHKVIEWLNGQISKLTINGIS